MSKIDLRQPVLDYVGDPLLGEDGQPVELRIFLINALNDMSESTTLEVKSKIFQVSTKLWSKSVVNLTIDDRAFINERVGASQRFNALLVGRINEILENQEPTLPSELADETSTEDSKPAKAAGRARRTKAAA